MAVLYRPCWIVAEVGVYDVRCERCKYFQAQVPGVPDRGRYLYEVRNTGAYALIRYRLPYHAVIRRMQEDHCLSLSLVISMIASGGPMKQIDMASHWAFVRACFWESYISMKSRIAVERFCLPPIRSTT
jgi:hypothetical protein